MYILQEMGAIMQREMIAAVEKAEADECIPVTQAPERRRSRLSTKPYVPMKS